MKNKKNRAFSIRAFSHIGRFRISGVFAYWAFSPVFSCFIQLQRFCYIAKSPSNQIGRYLNYIQKWKWSKCITENVHIEHRRGHPTCASCRSLSPENAIYVADNGRAGPYLYGSHAVSCGSVGGVLTQEETVLQISTCSGKLSVKAVLLEITSKKWYI